MFGGIGCIFGGIGGIFCVIGGMFGGIGGMFGGIMLVSNADNNLIRLVSLSACTVSPNKPGNSVTIFHLSTSAQLCCKINVLRGCVPATQAEVV